MECGICWKGKHCDFIGSAPDISRYIRLFLRSAYLLRISEASACEFSRAYKSNTFHAADTKLNYIR